MALCSYVDDRLGLSVIYCTHCTDAEQIRWLRSKNVERHHDGKGFRNANSDRRLFQEFYATGNYPAAELEANKLERAIKTQLGVNHVSYDVALNNLAIVFQAQRSPGSVDVIASDGLLPSLPPPTIWCGCPN